MTFAEAKFTRLPRGTHQGVDLDTVAASDEGLRYLDWMVGSDVWWARADTEFGKALRTYLEDEKIQEEVRAVIGGD